MLEQAGDQEDQGQTAGPNLSLCGPTRHLDHTGVKLGSHHHHTTHIYILSWTHLLSTLLEVAKLAGGVDWEAY